AIDAGGLDHSAAGRDGARPWSLLGFASAADEGAWVLAIGEALHFTREGPRASLANECVIVAVVGCGAVRERARKPVLAAARARRWLDRWAARRTAAGAHGTGARRARLAGARSGSAASHRVRTHGARRRAYARA